MPETLPLPCVEIREQFAEAFDDPAVEAAVASVRGLPDPAIHSSVQPGRPRRARGKRPARRTPDGLLNPIEE